MFCVCYVILFLICINLVCGGCSIYNYCVEGLWVLVEVEMCMLGYVIIWVLV